MVDLKMGRKIKIKKFKTGAEKRDAEDFRGEYETVDDERKSKHVPDGKSRRRKIFDCSKLVFFEKPNTDIIENGQSRKQTRRWFRRFHSVFLIRVR